MWLSAIVLMMVNVESQAYCHWSQLYATTLKRIAYNTYVIIKPAYTPDRLDNSTFFTIISKAYRVGTIWIPRNFIFSSSWKNYTDILVT